MESSSGLPAVSKVSMKAPFCWLAGGWSDLWKAPGPCLVYGLILALISFALSYGLVVSDAEFWALALTIGFVFVAPMLAMGLYEAGRQIEQGKTPRLGEMLYVRSATRLDLAYLGLFLVVVYLFWGRIAQIIYGLSTYQLHRTTEDFVSFALNTEDGQTMLITGTLVGGAIAYLTYCAVVVAAPMLLDRNVGVFAAVATSVRTVAENFWPMTLWAVLIGIFILIAAATGFIAFIVIFPWLGLATWRAYRQLVPQEQST